MLTKQAKQVLKSLKELTGNTEKLFVRPLSNRFFFLVGSDDQVYDFSALAGEINSIMDQLEREGMVSKHRDGYTLTQNAIHLNQYKGNKWAEYFRDNWIAVLALAVAIVSLIVSLFRCP